MTLFISLKYMNILEPQNLIYAKIKKSDFVFWDP